MILIINGEEFISPIWQKTRYVQDQQWSVTTDVPDNKSTVDVEIQLWDLNFGVNTLCDISGNYGYYPRSRIVKLQYSVVTGHWEGDDELGDPSGYGRLNGCDDGSIYQRERDCELWFDITQNDYDGDGIPYMQEMSYGTNPKLDDTGRDQDKDRIGVSAGRRDDPGCQRA